MGANGQLSSITGKLNSVEKISDIPSITVPTNKWIQISLNTAPQLGSTVDDVIGDDISAAYGID